jgi:hypothetical protein
MADGTPSDSLRATLTSLQEHYSRSLGRPLPTLNMYKQIMRGHVEAQFESLYPGLDPSRRKQLADKLYHEMLERANQVPSPYEEPIGYAIMRRIADAIEAAVQMANMPIESMPVLSTLPLGQINAKTILIPDTTEHIVAFDLGLIFFMHHLPNAIARAIPMKDQIFGGSIEGIRNRIRRDPSIVGWFSELVIEYATTGDPVLTPVYTIEPEYALPAHILRDSMMCFALAHEYGHVIAGHLSGRTPTAALHPHVDTEALEYSWRQELEADECGLGLSILAMHQLGYEEVSMRYSGADLYFSAMDIMDRAVSLLEYGDERRRTLGSHPPSDQRRSALRRLIAQNLGTELSAKPIMISESLEQAVNMLWRPTHAALLDIRKRGERVAPTWRM